MITLAVVVNGLPAQEQAEPDERRPAPAPRATPAPPAVMSWSGVAGGSHLGVYIREVTEEDVERLNLPEERGALVSDVPDDGPAAEAGLQADDVIVSWNGSRVESAAQLRRLVSETPAGRSVELGYVRDGRQQTASVELADRSPSVSRFFSRGEMDADARARLEESLGDARYRLRALSDGDGSFHVFMQGGRLGVGVQNLGDQLAEYFGASDGGVLVTTVREDSPAAEAGVRAGDVILRVGDERVEDPGDLVREIARADAGQIELRVLRDRQERTLRATLPERMEGARGIRSGNAYFFGPQAGVFEDLEFPDFSGFEFEVPAMPELELVFPDLAAPTEPSVST
jgi:membrane-associated protease RseP (regulator of RpoE activity)